MKFFEVRLKATCRAYYTIKTLLRKKEKFKYADTTLCQTYHIKAVTLDAAQKVAILEFEQWFEDLKFKMTPKRIALELRRISADSNFYKIDITSQYTDVYNITYSNVVVNTSKEMNAIDVFKHFTLEEVVEEFKKY